jgi:putative transposase
VRRACTLFKVARSALSYQSRKLGKDAPVIGRMKELSAQYPRYGCRRIRIFLGRGGYHMSPGRAYQLWRAAGLQLPRKRPRNRAAAARPIITADVRRFGHVINKDGSRYTQLEFSVQSGAM